MCGDHLQRSRLLGVHRQEVVQWLHLRQEEEVEREGKVVVFAIVGLIGQKKNPVMQVFAQVFLYG